MKTILSTIFAFMLSNLIYAQKVNIKSSTEKTKTNTHKTDRNKNITNNSIKISNSKKDIIKDEKNSTAQTDIDREINAILDYRINRVLRENLFCLVCDAYSNKGQLA